MAEKDPQHGKKETNTPSQRTGTGYIERGISSEMKESYLDYAMSVITSRALPDVRDGLKPVHRRILYSMFRNGLLPNAKFRKSATVVGDVIGSYHPHGDVAVYDAMVKMAQDFTYRYPLVIGQGNFGSIDGDAPAAYRYTEAKMSKVAEDLLVALDKDTVDWRPNFDATKKEPIVLPAAVPNLLINGQLGIAVGMATNIPPHNLREVCEAVIHLIDNDDTTNDDLVNFVHGPDFPTGGTAYNIKDIKHAYATGKGGVVVRGDAIITEGKKGLFQIIISSIPFRVNKADLIERIANLVHEKKIDGIRDIRDESAKDIRIAIDLKNNAQPQKVLNYLYKHTQLEETFHYNMVALVDDVPQTVSLKGILEEFVKHRRDVTGRRLSYELRKAEEREHILLGLSKALDKIDLIVKTIKSSKDTQTAHANLMASFRFSDKQAAAILDMRLQKLAGLERKKIEEELASVQDFIAKTKAILASEKKIFGVVKDELVEVMKKHGDDRRTKIVKSGIMSLALDDLIPEEESVLVLTAGGYVKRTNPNEYKKQKRGGVGVIDMDTKEEDFITRLLTTSTHDDLLFFTDKGKVYQIKMYDLPEGRRATKGKSLANYLSLVLEERVTSVLPMPKKGRDQIASLIMVTKKGVAKRVSAKSFLDVRRSGLIAIKLRKGDELISARAVQSGDDVVVVTKKGQSIRFKGSNIREMGRNAAGVRAIKLRSGDEVINAAVIEKGVLDANILVLSRLGFGKRTGAKEYKVQNRGGSGIKTAKVTPKTGELIASEIVRESEGGELVAISKKGQVIRIDLAEIPRLGRQTQGVRVMRLRAGDSIAALICL